MTKTTWRPIAGGSDDESSTGRDTDMAPHTPHYAQGVPAEP
jgi:hypothetical protein